MIVKCCKCFHNTRLFNCPKCGHKVCTSCKEQPRQRRLSPGTVRIDRAQLARDNELVHETISRYIRERM